MGPGVLLAYLLPKGDISSLTNLTEFRRLQRSRLFQRMVIRGVYRECVFSIGSGIHRLDHCHTKTWNDSLESLSASSGQIASSSGPINWPCLS